MLEELRRHSRSTIIYVLFGVIIAVFVINFGPGSRGCEGGVGGASYAAKVGNSTVTEQDFRFAFIAMGGTNISPQFARARRLREFILDRLIERELLAQEAERLGIKVSQKEVEDMIAEGRMIVLGVPRKVDDYVFVEGHFDYDRFKAVCQNRLGVTVVHFLEQEKRELMAERVRQLMLGGTRATPDEVKADFERHGLQVNLEYVRFNPRRAVDEVKLTPDEIAQYRKSHEKELRKYYDEHAFLYKKIDREAHLQRILVAAAQDAKPEAVKAAELKAGEAARRLKAGQAFADVAKAFSDDAPSKARGGELGWRRKGLLGLGQNVEDKVFAAKKGEVVGPERGAKGFEILRVVDIRQGDLPFEQVGIEIAEDQLRLEKAKESARKAAEQAKAKALAGEDLAKLFPKAASDAGEDDHLAKAGDLIKRQSSGPTALETGLFPRKGDTIPDVGISPELAKRAFEMKVGEVAGPFDIAGQVVIVKVKEHKDPDLADFEKRRDEIVRQFERQKWAEVMSTWSRQRCLDARDAGKIQVNEEILSYDGNKPAQGERYEPCSPSRF